MSNNGKNSVLRYMRKIPVSEPTHVEEAIEASSTNDKADEAHVGIKATNIYQK